MPGSDQKINYQIRPSKSIERKMLCEIIKDIQIILGNREFRYIGMGAKYFSDFLLIHNEFNIKEMISIEAEEQYTDRYEFNKPLKNIEMKYGMSNQILPQLEGFDQKLNVVWLDYDDAFSQEMLADVETLSRKIGIGSMFYISCNASVGGSEKGAKQAAFQEHVGDFYLEDTDKNLFTNKKIPLVIKKHFDHIITKGIYTRNKLEDTELEYKQLVFLIYSDGAPMVTIGGIIVDHNLKEKLKQYKLFDKYPFIVNDDEYFKIEIPKLTYKEIQLILKNIPLTLDEYNEISSELYHISFTEIDQFQKIYRYYPYYVEGSIHA